MNTILPVILIVVLLIVSLVVVIGVSLGIGWVLTLILPLSLFEGTLIGMIAALVTGIIWRGFLQSLLTFDLDVDSDEEWIPMTRFLETEADGTWEEWFQYQLANFVYRDFLFSPRWNEVMNEMQLQELSIRLADAAVRGLKKKSHRARMSVNKKMLQGEMEDMGQQPYDEEILDIAVEAVNEGLEYLEDDLRWVIKNRLWTEQAEVFW